MGAGQASEQLPPLPGKALRETSVLVQQRSEFIENYLGAAMRLASRPDSNPNARHIVEEFCFGSTTL
eukprot:COSAG01_NODE_762_length_13792_cov_19.126707_2_plen_67_part_00